MKTRAYRTFLMLGIFLTLAFASVQAQTASRLKAHIPFDFQVNDELFPAGAYVIEQSASGSIVTISKIDGRQRTKVLTDAKRQQSGEEGKAKIVFNHYGDQFFLATVFDGSGAGRAFRPSGNERNFRRELAGTDDGFKPTTVEIAIFLK